MVQKRQNEQQKDGNYVLNGEMERSPGYHLKIKKKQTQSKPQNMPLQIKLTMNRHSPGGYRP
jgi:hypothetical protein